MSGLNEFLDLYAPPPVPEGLAARAAAAAIKQPQQRPSSFWRRGGRRGGWKRGALIGSAAVGLALTSAVAAEVVSGGRIEIPVVHEVVEAIPVLKPTPREHPEKKQLAARATKRAPAPAAAVAPQAVAADQRPAQQRLMQRFQAMKQRVQERRAAGLPTPRADRIEQQAKRIVERRQAAGKPTPSIERVEGLLALREMKRMRQQRLAQRQGIATNITDEQVRRIAERLSPERRARFLALPPEVQRQIIARRFERMRSRRASQWQTVPPAASQQQPAAEPPEQNGSEGFPQPPR